MSNTEAIRNLINNLNLGTNAEKVADLEQRVQELESKVT